MSDHDFIDAAAGLWHDEFAGRFQPSACIAASAVLFEAATYFGHDANVLAVDTIAANPEAIAQLDAGTPVDDWPDEAWSVGTSHDERCGIPGRYDGHVVCIVDGTLVDLTAGQMSRPKRGLVIPEVIVADGSLASEGEIDLPGGHRITYVARPEQTGWKRAPDWKRRSATAGPFIRQLRALLA